MAKNYADIFCLAGDIKNPPPPPKNRPMEEMVEIGGLSYHISQVPFLQKNHDEKGE
ncbi:MAG TPA: hypothetical protein VHP58_02250 [Alphaproteobacteria bacterium]|nr:hypothetical protein [Alphaproteobacteria bacterium]